MVIGLKGKNNRRSSTVHIDYRVHIHEVKPWPPSQSLRSLRSVLIQWENGDHRFTGSTNSVTPSIGTIVGEGRIEFDESFKVPVTLTRDANSKSSDGSDSFLKNCLELNLFEARKDNTVKGQSLATAVIDFAEHGLLGEGLRIDVPMNCKRSFKNTDRPVLCVTIQPILKARAGLSSSRDSLSRVMSMESNGRESVSALMNEEYAEEAESDEDDSSRSSSAAASSSNGGLHNQNDENLSNKQSDTSEGSDGKHVMASKLHQNPLHEDMKRSLSQSSSLDLSSDLGSPQNIHAPKPHSCNTSTGEFIKSVEEGPNGDTQDNGNSNEKAKEIGRISLEEENIDSGDSRDDESLNAEDVTRRKSFGSDTSTGQGNLGTSENTPKSETSKLVKSVRADGQNSLASLRLKERKDAKVFPRDTRSAILESKLQQLELRVKMLEGELTEAAAVEASLYSVVAEHGSSGSKVHAPARRLARMYLHACKETSLSRRANAAASAVSGLVLVAKACGNDVPRLTFWLSNTVVLRSIIVQASGKLDKKLSCSSTNGINARKMMEGRNSPLKWKISSSGKREEIKLLDSRSTDWAEPQVFTHALEKIEAWIFSRIVESIWWQTLTPHMQSVDPKTTEKESDSETTKSYNRSFSSAGQEQGSFSLDLWKKAFRDSLERLCPVRAAGHECGCLPMLARIVMEQSVSRLDVAMFNAILRESGDDLPTDPVSDPIGDPRVLPIPAGTSSFEAGAQLKNAIGNWSRWLTDTFGIDDDDDPLEELNKNKQDERREKTFKSFHFLNALSDLMMLPKDMLLNKSIRKEVCPKFGAPLIKRVLDNFVPDEFCPDPIPNAVFEALESEDSTEEEESATNFPCDAAAILYSPPSTASIATIIGELGSQSHLRRSGSSILRKSYTSDDELDELNSPLALILNDDPRSSPTKSGWISKERNGQSSVRYELLRDVWMKSEI